MQNTQTYLPQCDVKQLRMLIGTLDTHNPPDRGILSGDLFLRNVPGGTRSLKIGKIMHQPEAVGDFFQ